MKTEEPTEKGRRSESLYVVDLSADDLEGFLARYRQGLPLTFRRETVTLRHLKSLAIGSTDQPSTVILPPLKIEFERQAAHERAREDARNRANRVTVYSGPICQDS